MAMDEAKFGLEERIKKEKKGWSDGREEKGGSH